MKTKRSRSNWLFALAAIFTAGEAVVTAGIELPFSGDIPQWLRALVVFLIVGGAFALRILAQREEDRK